MQPPDFGEASRRSETLLRESEERFRLLVASVKDYAIFMLDPEGHITTWNRGAQRIKGYDAEEIVGEHFSVFYTDDDIERRHPEEELRIAASEGSYEEEGLRLRKDGSTFWASVVITALTDEGGNLQGFAKVTRDITARKEAEERELLLAREQAARERATDILESISDASFAVDHEWRFTYVNGVAEKLWGRSREELLGRNLWEKFPRVVGSEYHRRLERAMEEGVATAFEAFSSDLGAWVSGRAYPSQEGLSVFFRDVTERKRAEEERARLAAIVESSDDVIIGKTLDGVITSWNRGAEKIYGYSAAEAVGRPVSMLVPPERPDEIPSILATIRRGEKVDHFETERVAKDGRRLNISLSVSPIRNAAGNIVGAATIARDITERKRAEETIRQAREAERRRIARDLHDDVLQDLSYTAAAMGIMTLKVEDMGLTEDLRKAIDAVRRAAHGLRGAVYDLRLDEEDRPFHELVGAVVHRTRSMNPDRDFRLSVKAGFPSRPLGAAGVELLRVIQEALTNARRHSEARNVWVSLAVDGDALVADVADDGGGFDPEASPGTGLRGMRERALLLGGSLRVESAPGEGTRVRVRVPMPAAPQDVPGDETGLHGQGR